MRLRELRSDTDKGMTLIEIMVGITIASIIMAVGVGSWRAWALASAESGSARSALSIMRSTQQRAISEGMSFCVNFDTPSNAYTVYRYACGSPSLTKVAGPYRMDDDRVLITNPTFKNPNGSTSTGVTFRSTGSAWAGNVTIAREKSDKIYTIKVEGFTGRVSLN